MRLKTRGIPFRCSWWVCGLKVLKTQGISLGSGIAAHFLKGLIVPHETSDFISSQDQVFPVATEQAFVEFPKMARLRRECIITEKIDGTNACIKITEDGLFLTGSRTRWITPSDDNYGFSAWAHRNIADLMKLGPGTHFGEWWGSGCQRGYGLSNGEKRWSLFNVARWCLAGETPQRIFTADPRVEKYQEALPDCCSLVPLLYRGIFDTNTVDAAMLHLRVHGSKAVPGFMRPEGIVCYHVAGNVGFKVTLEKDDEHKSKK